MATTLVKGLVAVGALGTASGVGTLVYLNTRDSTTIADKLSKEGLTKITKQGDYKFHLFDKQSEAKLKKLLVLTEIDHKQHASNLEKWCQDNLKKNVSEDKDNSIFDNAKAFCVVPTIRTLGDKVKGKMYEKSEWQAKYVDFVRATSTNGFADALKKDFGEVVFNESTNNGGEKLEQWCGKTKITNTYDSDKHKSEANFKAWCIKTPS